MMQFNLLLSLSLLVSSSSALTMHRPAFLDIRTPSELSMALQAAMVTTTLKLSQQSANCDSLNDIQIDQGTLPPVSPGLELYHVAVGRGTQVSFPPKMKHYHCQTITDRPPFRIIPVQDSTPVLPPSLSAP